MNFFTKKCKNGNDIGLLILRLVFAIVLIYGHGFDKLSVIFSGQEIQFMAPIGIGRELSSYSASFAEGICSILLLLGLFTRLSALVLTMNFIVIFIFHAFMVGDGFVILEPRFFYLFAFIALGFTGAGKFSLDYLLFRKKGE